MIGKYSVNKKTLLDWMDPFYLLIYKNLIFRKSKYTN